ncbi:trypsin epsilon-like [Homalodisca vitripennis]|uniref:trypsin epsilon-like n=1 Tax=Homalodisca vitripennis TaxID=197043 RepID=UPI001EEC5C86|nr:trypsin epsilon-like [Homalodisca vitripennis]XP_046661984.1 trypsin epsilon-like [Homalodisca vitripennis]XP_046661986.1 trypsin epsilon-like [Homalodisca vitripennis]KAG8303629.1 hypothetical protein J6590_002628 [Homalodisca vitripennis]
MSRTIASVGTGCLIAFTAVFLSQWGQIVAQNRILGGYETTIEDVPYQLSLEGGRRHVCGGSVLTQNWALTAAHCVYNEPVRWMSFRAGSTTRGYGGTVHPFKYYIYHEKYSGRKTLDYDVAVVFVKVPFDFKTGIAPVTLPFSMPREGERVLVSGWGFLEPQQLRKPKNLVATEIRVFSWEECKKMYWLVTPRMMCAGDGYRDICGGDSGGPLVRGRREQVGIVSWGYKCGDGMPSVYTNISAVVPWIREKTGMDDYIMFPPDYY